jgi:1-deoxy-D-xylulose-5-phosphate synthase
MTNSLSMPADGSFANPDAGARREAVASTARPRDALLPKIQGHAEVAALDQTDLPRLAEEIREKILEVVCKNGGHLGSNFGVVELAIALHRVYDFAHDVIVWDVGHQCYPHKLLTGRAGQFHTLRSKDGVSGYPHPAESPHDVMRSGHAGTAISMGLGVAAADGVFDRDRSVVAVVGDSALGAGVALEALNYAAHVGRDILVILNDNEMSISETVGSLASYLNRLRAAPIYTGAKERFHALLRSVPFGERLDKNLVDMVDAVKAAIAPGHLFEELGFRYYGPVGGHDIEVLVDQLESLKGVPGVKLLHVVTKKGKGLEPTGKDIRYLHGVNPGTRLPGFAPSGIACALDKAPSTDEVPPAIPAVAAKKAKNFTEIFGDAICRLADKDPRIVAITAAMPEGTGLVEFAKKFPGRFHDTGITEQHAVAFAGGLAKGGARPVAAIYSTFLQRGYDQVFQEAILQDLPVVFALDRGGLVGQDGPSHNGCYDIAYLRTFPNLVMASPRDGSELRAMLELGINQNHPFALRYPRGSSADPELPVARKLEVGKAEVLRDGTDVTLVAFGPLAYDALAAADQLAARGVSAAVINARFVKPLDTELLGEFASKTKLLVTIEEHQVMGGFGSAVLEALAAMGGGLAGKVLPIGIPDRLIEHAARNECLEDAGLTAPQIAATVLARL